MTDKAQNTSGSTARPWKYERNSVELKLHGYKIYGDEKDCPQFGKSCMPISYTFQDGATAKANAELIVRAVNRDHAYEELLETVKATKKYFIYVEEINLLDIAKLMTKVNNVLKLAEGK